MSNRTFEITVSQDIVTGTNTTLSAQLPFIGRNKKIKLLDCIIEVDEVCYYNVQGYVGVAPSSYFIGYKIPNLAYALRRSTGTDLPTMNNRPLFVRREFITEENARQLTVQIYHTKGDNVVFTVYHRFEEED